MQNTKYDFLKIKTNNAMLLWKNVFGIAPDTAAWKLDQAMLQWQRELTETLGIWIDKGIGMTEGELILAYANLGAVVESWLKFFYCVYYEDYRKQPIKTWDKKTKKKKEVEPERADFDDLKKFSVGKIWKDKESKGYQWVSSVQYKRNAIHSFAYRDLGTAQDFLDDVDQLYEFVDDILSRIPDLEDFLETCPPGYIIISPLL